MLRLGHTRRHDGRRLEIVVGKDWRLEKWIRGSLGGLRPRLSAWIVLVPLKAGVEEIEGGAYGGMRSARVSWCRDEVMMVVDG